MAHRRLCKASAIFSILVLLFVSISVVSCDIQFTRGTAIQEVFEDQLVNDDVSLHPTESSMVTIKLVPDTSVPETIETYIVKFYRNDEEVKSVEVPPIGPLSFVLTDLPRASYRIVGRAITEDGVAVAIGEAYMKVSSNGTEVVMEFKDVGHIMKPHPRVEATCTASGNIEYWHCTRCGLDFTDEEGLNHVSDTTIPAKGHSTVHVGYKAPSCTEAGTIDHWHCDRCERDFMDEEGSSELDDVAVSALGHDWSTDWSHDEHSHWHICTRCSTTGDVADHAMEVMDHRDATEDDAGYDLWECSVCGYQRKDDLPPINHNWVEVSKKGSTCLEEGYITYRCSDCGKEYTKTLAKLSHSTTHVEAVAATCTEPGNHEYWYCSKCGFYYKNEVCSEKFEDKDKTVIGALGHDWPATWKNDSDSHWRKCKRCNEVHKEHHSYDQQKETTEYRVSDATCESPAIYRYSCICGERGIETFTVGEQLGHDMHFVKAVDPTCTADGNVAHWHCGRCDLDFEDEGASKQIQEVVLAKLGHNYEMNNNESQHWMQCSRCGDIKDAKAHSWVLEAESEEGRTFRCSECSRTKTERKESDDSSTGFHVDIVSSEPKGRISYVDNEDGSWTFTFNDENPSSPSRIVFWEVDGEEVSDSDGLVVLDLNTPSKRSYRILCVFTNGNGYGSCEVVVTGGSV